MGNGVEVVGMGYIPLGVWIYGDTSWFTGAKWSNRANKGLAAKFTGPRKPVAGKSRMGQCNGTGDFRVDCRTC